MDNVQNLIETVLSALQGAPLIRDLYGGEYFPIEYKPIRDEA
jgi:hypothetical protein